MAKIARDELIAAPIVGTVAAALTYFVLYSLAGFGGMSGDFAGVALGPFLSVVFAGIVGAVIFGELLAQALGAK